MHNKNMSVTYDYLRKNIIDIIKESQIKLGYNREGIRLYYTLQSLNRLLMSELDSKEMLKELGVFAEYVKKDFGALEISCKGERFCLCFLPV